MAETKVGIVFQYFSKPQVAAVRLNDGALKVGDSIHILGNTTDLKQHVDSMQVHNQPITEAPVGSEIGIRVEDRVRPNDVVYKVTE